MDEIEALLEEAKSGDVTATGELFERFRGMAIGYAWSLLGDWHLAEDAVQAAYFEACLHLSRVYNANAFPAWLRRLVFKQCDRIRRKRPQQTVALDEATVPSASTTDASDALEEHQRVQDVRAALVLLPELERLVTLLHYFQMRSRGEIAAFLELTPDQVAYRLRSARRLFSDWIQPRHGGPACCTTWAKSSTTAASTTSEGRGELLSWVKTPRSSRRSPTTTSAASAWPRIASDSRSRRSALRSVPPTPFQPISSRTTRRRRWETW